MLNGNQIKSLDKIRNLYTNKISHSFQSRYLGILNQESFKFKNPDYKWKPVILEAPTGAGKSTMGEIYIDNIDKIHSDENTTVCFSAPSSSNSGVYKWIEHIVNDVISKENVGLVIDKTVLNSSKVNEESKNLIRIYHSLGKIHLTSGIQSQTDLLETNKFLDKFKYTFAVGLNSYHRTKILPAINSNKSILDTRTIQMIIDEVHGELGSGSEESYELNYENNQSSFPATSTNIFEQLESLRIATIGLTGTSTKEQRQGYSNKEFEKVYNKPFDNSIPKNEQYYYKYYGLTKKEQYQVQTRNASLDRIECLGTELNMELPNEFYWFKKRIDGSTYYTVPNNDIVIKKLNDRINDIVYNEFKNSKGAFLVGTAIKAGSTKHGLYLLNGLSTQDILKHLDTGALNWSKDSILVWDGKAQALVSDIDIDRYCESYSTYRKIKEKGTLDSVLDKYNGQIKLVLLKNMNKTAFDYPHIDGNIWLDTTGKTNEFIRNTQFFGRTVRNGDNDIVHIFLNYGTFKYVKNNIECSPNVAAHLPDEVKEMDGLGGDKSGRYSKMVYQIMYQRKTITSAHNRDKTLKELDSMSDEPLIHQACLNELNKMSSALVNDDNFKNQVISPIMTMSKYGEKPLSNGLVSTIISDRIEAVAGTYGFNIVGTGGSGNHEDGFVWYIDATELIQTRAYDIKVILEKRNGQRVMIKDKTRGDGKIDQSVIYLIYVIKEDENGEIYFDRFYINEFNDTIIEQHNSSNSISLTALDTVAISKVYALNDTVDIF